MLPRGRFDGPSSPVPLPLGPGGGGGPPLQNPKRRVAARLAKLGEDAELWTDFRQTGQVLAV